MKTHTVTLRQTIIIGVACALVGSIAGSLLNPLGTAIYNRYINPEPLHQPPEKIIEWIYGFDTVAQAQLVAERTYLGKTIETTGTITDIGKSSNTSESTIHLPSLVGFADYQTAAAFNKGNKVNVIGRIFEIVTLGNKQGVVKIQISQIKAVP